MDCELDNKGIMVRYSIGVRKVSLLRIVQSGPWAHQNC